METTHNLEVVGSSPTWSTSDYQAVTRFVAVFYFTSVKFMRNSRAKNWLVRFNLL